jgi:hypothetical protein
LFFSESGLQCSVGNSVRSFWPKARDTQVLRSPSVFEANRKMSASARIQGGGSFMKNLFRALIGWLAGLLVLLALMLLAGCSGAPGCPQVGFGSSTPCSAGGGGNFGTGGSGGGGGGGGGGGSTPSVFAYAIDSQNDTIDGYSFSASAGTFAAMSSSSYTPPTIPGNTGGVGMVVAQEEFLYAGFASTGQIVAYTISSTGQLTAVTGSPFTASYLAGFTNGVGQSAMVTNPAGTLLFASDPLGGNIYVYQIDSSSSTTPGALTAVPGSPFPVPLTDPAFTPMNLATDGLGSYLYAIDSTSGTHQGSQIAAFSIANGENGTTLGVLTPVTGSPFSGIGYNMWLLKGEPTGQFMIGTTGSTEYDGNPDDEHLYVFGIAQSGASNPGAITQVSGSPFTTQYSPFSIAVQPTGNLVYSFSVSDAGALNPIEGYTLGNTGTLTVDTNSPFTSLTTAEGSWGQFDPSGTYLFTYFSYTNSSDVKVGQIAPITIGADGALTQPATPVTLVTSGFWVVTDPN